jgi:hypothetical protein
VLDENTLKFCWRLLAAHVVHPELLLKVRVNVSTYLGRYQGVIELTPWPCITVYLVISA